MYIVDLAAFYSNVKRGEPIPRAIRTHREAKFLEEKVSIKRIAIACPKLYLYLAAVELK